MRTILQARMNSSHDGNSVFRKWLAGWMSRFGGFWVALADRIWAPPELRRYVIDHNDHARRESRGWI